MLTDITLGMQSHGGQYGRRMMPVLDQNMQLFWVRMQLFWVARQSSNTSRLETHHHAQQPS